MCILISICLFGLSVVNSDAAALPSNSGETLCSALGLRGRPIRSELLTALQNVVPQLQEPAEMKNNSGVYMMC